MRAELAALAAAGVCAPGTVPSCSQLRAAGKLGLYVRLCSIAGGMAPLARLLGMGYAGRRCTRRADAPPPEAVLSQQDGLAAELRGFVAAGPARQSESSAKRGLEPLMPPRRALLDAGRQDLWDALLLSGGASVVAERLGWRVTARGRPRGSTLAR